ncbi:MULTISPECIES: hypothetical protein [Acinetobacter]|jgi:hypothetical protein|uniref:hypothetical protein n=1 Tax=Acinetobacter TaxID=469 RepID=UPI0009923464|nr:MULTISPECIES: hypothetical protein [Acinetobacter]MCL6245395.1 hypothetical protein [Acinetobacter amyesii]OOV83135.1 hypothetical protein B1201_05735 [Acinetobacter sp. ANC 5600]UUS58128.1 hypothetical protein MST16_02675 [Acinetobacter sp. YH16040_T]
MLTILVEVILSFFISNYESENYPYLAGFIKGIVLGISAFLLGMLIDVINDKIMETHLIILYFITCIGIGIIGGLFFMFFTWFTKK